MFGKELIVDKSTIFDKSLSTAHSIPLQIYKYVVCVDEIWHALHKKYITNVITIAKH